MTDTSSPRTFEDVIKAWAKENGARVRFDRTPADHYVGAVRRDPDFYVEVYRVDGRPDFRPLLHEATGVEAAAESIRAFGRSTTKAQELAALDFTGCVWRESVPADLPF